ncbi:S41 family peptidase [Aquirhabdus sp.]|uniref:S41 family peptidase n=1 Tax=Aquirhabdus sp. TaxID=2824160 RepID=UPI00396CF0DE
MKTWTLTRRSFARASITVLAAATLPRLAFSEPAHDVSSEEDFDELWHTLKERYCFFQDKHTDWDQVRALYRPLAIAAETDDAYMAVLGQVLNELYDAHTQLSNAPDGTQCGPFYDLLVERVDAGTQGAIRIKAIRDGSAATDAGLVIGDLITEIDGQPIDHVVQVLMPKCLSTPDPTADVYTINVAASGRRGQARRFTVVSHHHHPREVQLPFKKWVEQPNIESKRLDDDIGYIVIRSFADNAVLDTFDRALSDFRDTRGLIIDVRNNGGGDTAIAKPIMGRFISKPLPYALMRRRDGKELSDPWTEILEPRGPFTYTQPVVVLTSHWSASMAEGFPMGMRGIGRATIVGTPMMGLGAAVFQIHLDRTGIQAQYSGEPVYDVQDRPRWQMRPDVEVPYGGDILAAGIKTLKKTLVPV